MTKGNNAADKAAQEALGCTIATIVPAVTIEPEITTKDVADIQEKASEAEKHLWIQRAAQRDANGVLQ